jgi:hypothetical protein
VGLDVGLAPQIPEVRPAPGDVPQVFVFGLFDPPLHLEFARP